MKDLLVQLASNEKVRKRFRQILLVSLMAIVVLEIVVLSPVPLEQETVRLTRRKFVDPKTILEEIQRKGEISAPGVPTNRIPDDSSDQFVYLSAKGEAKDWKIVAETANMFHDVELVHGRIVTAHLYDEKQDVTIVRGREAKYFMNDRKIEMFGDVQTTFPDGFTIMSEYMRYEPERKEIVVPENYDVAGEGTEKNEDNLNFTSKGLHYDMDANLVYLNKEVRFLVEKVKTQTKRQSEEDFTEIDSDHAVIDRNTQVARFTMRPSRPLKDRFVRFRRPTLLVNSRLLDLYYGGDTGKSLQRLVAINDVFIREIGEDSAIRYGTCGEADYDAVRNIVVLTKFPQVYQDRDTITGDRITIFRDTDVVEVERSNAYSQGS